MRAAIYARVSTLDQEPENQLEELRRYVSARGWTGAEHVDRGVTRVSLFVRNVPREDFAYLGELAYQTHREFREERQGKVQQEYLFRLLTPVPDDLLIELTAEQGPTPRRTPTVLTETARSRRASSLDSLKTALSYALGRLERVVVPAHHNYQVRLKRFLETKGVNAEWEKDFVDLRFELDGETYIGEIKVTTTLRLEEAFRTALGQLLEYGFIRFTKRPHMVMFLDRELDSVRTRLASELGIAVINEQEGRYRIQNPEMDYKLADLFR